MRSQHTIASSVSCSGVGLHSGRPVTLTLRPASPDTGIVFILKDGAKSTVLHASIENLVPTELCTALCTNGTQIKTVEHILAAFAGLEIDNVYIELDANEVPAMDGSAGPFVRLLRTAGIMSQNRRQPFLKITQPIEVTDGAKRVSIEPATTSKITYSIHYQHPLIQTQTYMYESSVAMFERDISTARTFGFLHEVEALWSRGLGKGGSLENTVVLSEQGVVNESGLRFTNEFVRHKILDLIGDFSLLGVPFIGHLIADRSGHSLHTKLVETILEQPDRWVLLNVEDSCLPLEPCPSQKPAPAHSLALQASSVQ
ncbi:MAG: UDP-3-O-acyl-N-acetylglucosamine deacetylase [Nitrospiraceae bacterium]